MWSTREAILGGAHLRVAAARLCVDAVAPGGGPPRHRRPTAPGPAPDYAALQVFAIYAAVFIVIGTILADLVAARLDPKVKTGGKVPA